MPKKGGWCCNCMAVCPDRFCKQGEECTYPPGPTGERCVLVKCEDFVEYDPLETI